jgi:hypothetical protein
MLPEHHRRNIRPDQAYVLHPIFERVDGKPVLVESIDGTQYVDRPDQDRALLRRVSWAEVCESPGGCRWSKPATTRTGRCRLSTSSVSLIAVRTSGPRAQGAIDDAATRHALFNILIEHTSGGAAAICTAFHWALGPTPADSDLLRGPLSAWPELFSSEHVYSPQNIWPRPQRTRRAAHACRFRGGRPRARRPRREPHDSLPRVRLSAPLPQVTVRCRLTDRPAALVVLPRTVA